MSALVKLEPAEAYRHVPRDIDVEQALLGAILKDNQAMERVGTLIKAETFYDPLHGRIFATMSQMIEQGGVVVTPLTLHASMKSDPGVIETGGQAYFDALRAAAPAIPNVKDYADILTGLAVRRGLIRLGGAISSGAYEPPSDVDLAEIIESADRELRALADLESEQAGTAIRFIDVPAWQGTTPPPRQWAVQDRIPTRCTTLLSGEGSVGKSLLAAQLAVATVLGKEWLGIVPQPGPAIIMCCEDDADELHRRFQRIAEYYGVSFSALAHLHPMSLVGRDATFAGPNRNGIIEPTPLFRRMMKEAKAIRPSVLILDNSADIYAGNENDRVQVRRFITLLNEIAIQADTAVLLTAHPSLTGITSGSGISGSTAWHASVRSRLYMRKPKQEGDDAADPDERVLEVMKSNYGPPGESISLRWENGLFVPVEAAHWLDKQAQAGAADDLFLKLLARFEKQDRNVSDKPTAPNYAPTVFSREPDAKDKRIKKAAFADGMARLFQEDKIHLETYGRTARPAQKLATGPKP